MSKLLGRMLGVLFTASLSFGAIAGQPNQSASDGAQGKLAQAEPANSPAKDNITGKSGSDYKQQRGVTDGSPSGSRAEVQAGYKAAVANCNNQSGTAKTDCMKKAAKQRDKAMSSMKAGTKSQTGVSGRAGTAAGTHNSDSAPIGEKPGNPTSQGSSALDRENKDASGDTGSKRK